jgi:hypothetical protein
MVTSAPHKVRLLPNIDPFSLLSRLERSLTVADPEFKEIRKAWKDKKRQSAEAAAAQNTAGHGADSRALRRDRHLPPESAGVPTPSNYGNIQVNQGSHAGLSGGGDEQEETSRCRPTTNPNVQIHSHSSSYLSLSISQGSTAW